MHTKHLLPAIIATGILSFAGVLIETAMNVTFPQLITQFGITTSNVQWVTTAYLLVISIMVPFTNYLLKRFSLKNLFITANLLFIIGLAIDFFAPTFTILLVGRVLQGISTGIALPLMFHIILNFAPLEKRGTMMGIGTLTTAVAPAIGPTYGGILTSSLSWHYVFLFLLPILIISLIIGIITLPQVAPKHRTNLDVIHLISVALLFSGLLLFFNQVTSMWSLIPLTVGILGLVLFIKRAHNAPNPLMHLDVLKNRTYQVALLGFLACHFLLLGCSFILPNFVQLVMGQSAFIAGLTMLPGATVGAFLAPFAGRILDQHGPKKPIMFGLLMATIGLITIIALTFKPILPALIIAYILMLIGTGFAYSNLITIGMNALSKPDYGDGNTIYNTLQQFAGAFITTIVATIINLAQTTSPTTTLGTLHGSQLALGLLLIYLLVILITMNYYFKKHK